MNELEYIKKIERDVDEVKKDVKSLMLFMAVENAQDTAKNVRNTIIVSSIMSLLVSTAGVIIGKLL